MHGTGRQQTRLVTEIKAEQAEVVDTGLTAPQQGNQAVQQWYRDHRAPLTQQLARKSGCLDLAQDILQDAFVRLLGTSAERLDEVERPRGFLATISANLMRDRFRRTQAERQAFTAQDHASPWVDQVAVLEARDRLRQLEAIMGKLRPRTREIFLAHRIEGLSYAEIAARTGLSVKGVEKQMSKAIAKIDRLLERD